MENLYVKIYKTEFKKFKEDLSKWNDMLFLQNQS